MLVHGILCDSRIFRVEIEALSSVCTVVAWDAPGCGQSSDPPEHFRLPEYATCLDGLITALGLDRVHVLGHSLGSSLALELYRLHPEVVRSLILVGPYAGWAGSLPPDEVERRLNFSLRAADLLPGGFDPTTMPGLFSDAMPEERRVEMVRIMSEIRPAATRATAHALAEADLRELLPSVEVPTLLIVGDADHRSPVDVARRLHAAMPTSTLTVLPGLGHQCFLESPDTLHTLIRDFVLAVGP